MLAGLSGTAMAQRQMDYDSDPVLSPEFTPLPENIEILRLENGLMTAEQLAVRGKFDDFRIGMKTGVLSLGTTATKFVISPITTPFKRLFKEDLPEDGALPRSTLLSEV